MSSPSFLGQDRGVGQRLANFHDKVLLCKAKTISSNNELSMLLSMLTMIWTLLQVFVFYAVPSHFVCRRN